MVAQSSHISVRGLTHIFASDQGSLTALSNVNLEVERGEFVSIIGPSGCGKTTFLRAIGGLLRPTSGSILLDGVPPKEAHRHKAIGFVFQDPALLPWKTAIQNIEVALQLNAGQNRSDMLDPAQIMDSVGLADFWNYYPYQLSGGMRHRVALARALVLEPSVLLMDEPLGSLDEITRTAMRYELVRLWEASQKTVVFITHSIPEAVLLSDRVVVMSAQPGRLLDELRIALPRPRDESLEQSDQFLEYTRQIKQTLSLGALRGTSAAEG